MNFQPSGLTNAYVQKTLTAKGECQLTNSKPVGFLQAFTFALAKNNGINNRINQRHLAKIRTLNNFLKILLISKFSFNRMIMIWERGLLDYWGRKVPARSRNKCSDRRIDRPKNSRISFQSLTGAFIILGVGICVSLFTFLLEISCYYRKTRHARIQKDAMP